jgi:acetylornithine deacetylase/succinyl-diaminopimelate desuccinylase-like protein
VDLRLTIDWDAATHEATALLREYLRLDTSNPPGNEERATRFLGGVLRAEGIPFETADSAPGRSNLFARIGPERPNIALLNHTDVVPVERRFWDVDPFGGEERDGMIWGRGALDMKGMGIIELMTVMLLKREGLPLRRGVAFLAAADEEAGSEFGVTWLAEHRPGWLESDLVINEGAYGLTGIGGTDVPIFQLALAEKVPVWVQLKAEGRPGHGSVPHGDNCADRLVQALGRISAWRQALRVTPTMEGHLAALSEAGVLGGLSAGRSIEAQAARSPALRARLTNTIALTTISTGIKVNVIPAEATATLDCRLLPDVDPEAFLAELRDVIGDERVQVEVLNRYYPGNSESLDSEFARTVRDVVTEMVEGARVAPEMTSGFTDSRIYRLRGVPAYGFVPCLVAPEELAGVHGHNERISIENLRLGMQVLYEIVRRLCVA